MKNLFLILLLFQLNMHSQIKKYVALGDSYTICTGSKESDWPGALVKDLNSAGIKVELVANPARNGFTTQNLIRDELPLLKKHKPDFVTILIGVNDWVRGVSAKDFEKNLQLILDETQKNITKKTNIILIGIPDFGVTPKGSIYANGRDISNGIKEFNDIIKKEGAKRKLHYVDLFTLSKEMGKDPTLVSDDGLHPSSKEYLKWEKEILPVAKKLLSN